MNNLTGLTKNNNNVSITSETSSIGDKCLKLIPLSDKNYAMGVELSFANEDIGKTITAIADIKCNVDLSCIFQLRDMTDTHSVKLNVSNNTYWKDYTLSSTITETTMVVYVFAKSNTNGEVFLDNLKVTVP